MSQEASSTPSRPAAKLLRFAIGIVALVVAVGIFLALKATKPSPHLAPVHTTVRQVRVLTIEPVEVARSWRGYGSTRALRAADVAAEVQGVVIERPASIEAGLPVEFGDILVVIDPSDFLQRVEQHEQAVAAFQAELTGLDAEAESLDRLIALAAESTALTRSEIERWRAAAARSAGAPVELERLNRELSGVEREEQTLRERRSLIPSRRLRIEAQLAAERAAVATGRRDLERTRIAAPLTGVLQSVSVDRGERVGPGSPIARIVDLTRIEVPLQLPVSAAADIQPGDRAEIYADGPVEAVWQGAVARVSPEADASNRTITAFIEIRQPAEPGPGDPPRLLPGMFVSGVVSTEAERPQIVVPRNAIDRGAVLTVDADGVIGSAPVTVLHYFDAVLPELDPVESQWAVISAGLEPGQRIAISNLDELRPGAQVEPVEAAHGPRARSDRAADGEPRGSSRQ